MRYIGGKSLLLDKINNVVFHKIPHIHTVLDIFAGTGIVSQNFKQLGLKVFSNDYLYFSYILQSCYIGLNNRPDFTQLGIVDPISYLNNLTIESSKIPLEKCFIYQNYSPVNGCERMYFQPRNALKIDIVRITIEDWYKNGLIDDNGRAYLIASLIEAVPYVANITGVYAAYLKFWDKRTFNDLELKDLYIFNNHQENQCFNLDYNALNNISCDLLYADPPYNSREYLPNYHILETIARYDYPQIHGKTGMREYSNMKSDFCKKRKVRNAFQSLISNTSCRYILISYNNEGLIDTNSLSELCSQYAVKDSFQLYEFDYRRYKNKIPNTSDGLKEQLYFLERK